MSFQYTYDANGKPVGVFIPIHEWEELTAELKKARTSATGVKSPTAKRVLKGIKQVEQIRQGKIKSISLKQLFDEL